MSTRQVLIGVVFLAGCAVGGVSSQLVAPPARAADATSPRWQHYCFAQFFDEATDELRKAGDEGWELVSASPRTTHATVLYCFKRPVP